MAADGYAAARELAALARRRASRPGRRCRVLHVDSQLERRAGPQLGGALTLRAEVALNGLSPDDVDVQAVYGPSTPTTGSADTQPLSLNAGRGRSTTRRRVTRATCRWSRTGSFGYTVRVLPKNDLLASPAELGVIAAAG